MKITDDEKTFVNYLSTKLRRHAEGTTLRELSRRTGMSDVNAARILNGKCPNPSILAVRRLAKAVGLHMYIHIHRGGFSYPIREFTKNKSLLSVADRVK